jgi:pimeloyl-[acyl-carrier protein] methyl ester esterase
MMRPTLLFLHGWGFDAGLWDALAGELSAYRIVRWDRGYFGEKAEAEVEPPFAAIGHSLGAMMLANFLPHDVPLVAINGFDHFVGDDAVAPRVLERMRSRFAEDPAEVLRDFRQRCGAPSPPEEMDEARLGADLALLGSRRVASAPLSTLSLQGGRDPILPESLRERVFPGAERATHAQAGHLLPITHPAWCAERIEAFLCR